MHCFYGPMFSIFVVLKLHILCHSMRSYTVVTFGMFLDNGLCVNFGFVIWTDYIVFLSP